MTKSFTLLYIQVQIVEVEQTMITYLPYRKILQLNFKILNYIE